MIINHFSLNQFYENTLHYTNPDCVCAGNDLLPPMIYNPISKNMNNIGINTNIHDTIEAPELQIKFNTHVQNITYSSFSKKINIVLDASHE